MRHKPTVDKLEIRWRIDTQEPDCKPWGCVVIAHISYQMDGSKDRRLEWLSSGGLWGLDDDDSDAYRRPIEDEQILDLIDHLQHFNITYPRAEWERLIREARA